MEKVIEKFDNLKTKAKKLEEEMVVISHKADLMTKLCKISESTEEVKSKYIFDIF